MLDTPCIYAWIDNNPIYYDWSIATNRDGTPRGYSAHVAIDGVHSIRAVGDTLERAVEKLLEQCPEGYEISDGCSEVDYSEYEKYPEWQEYLDAGMFLREAKKVIDNANK